MYQIVLGWKSYKYCYETDELPNPRPTQHKKKYVKSGIWVTFSPQQKHFSWVGIEFYIGNSLQETSPNQILRKHPINSTVIAHVAGW